MPKLLIFHAFTLLIREENVVNHTLLQCKNFGENVRGDIGSQKGLGKIFVEILTCLQ